MASMICSMVRKRQYSRALHRVALAVASVAQPTTTDVICHFRGNIVGGKRIMKLLGFDLGPNRVPFRNMTDEEEAQMKKELEEIGFFERANKF